MSTTGNLFDGQRLQMNESIAFTIDSLNLYGPRFEHWAIAHSGGKDSTATLTLVVQLILMGKVKAPKKLSVLFADTRLELLPLWFAAQTIHEELRDKAPELAALGCSLDIQTVMAPMDKRFMVYILGRGVPPSNNASFRWCTRQIKIDPMKEALERIHGGTKLLMLTGVRQGESASRDGRIALSCSKDDAECGQGWYQRSMPDALCDTLAPLLHWRVCHVWEFLRTWAPTPTWGDWSTEIIADAYGGEEAIEQNARTGCIGCPLVDHDTAIDNLVKRERWAYLAPLKRIRPIWREMRLPKNRLRKPGTEARKDGTFAKNPQRMGPLTFEARRYALAALLAIQDEVNAGRGEHHPVDFLNAEEVARILELIEAKTWPEKWDGDEPTGDVWLDSVFADGTVQPLLPMFGRPAT